MSERAREKLRSCLVFLAIATMLKLGLTLVKRLTFVNFGQEKWTFVDFRQKSGLLLTFVQKLTFVDFRPKVDFC